MLEKTFTPADVEARHYARWEQGGYFAANLKDIVERLVQREIDNISRKT